jgi:DNA invertase Pin-like site-specific DNA recombinase
MKFQLTNEIINIIDQMLSEGMKLRAIAKKLKVTESTLRWQLNKTGLDVTWTGRLVPIHAPALDREHAA